MVLLKQSNTEGPQELNQQTQDPSTTFGREQDDDAAYALNARGEQQVQENLSFEGKHPELFNIYHSTVEKSKQLLETFVPRFVSKAPTPFERLKDVVDEKETVLQDMNDFSKNPEMQWDANLRTGLELSQEEIQFLAARKAHMRQAFADYVGVNINEVHEDDIPVIASAGSGGGFRAMIAIGGYMAGAHESGLFDIITYIAGVSGACWGIAQFYTIANCSHERLLQHYKYRLQESPGSIAAMQELMKIPDALPSLFKGIEIKRLAKIGITAMDLYGVLIAGHLLLPNKEDGCDETGGDPRRINHEFLKLSSQRHHIERGEQPMPLYTAIRHERPWKDWVDPEYPFGKEYHNTKEHKNAPDAWFQWFEFNPYEIGCDELQYWQPSWSFGRHFEEQASTERLPEQSMSLQMGLWGSAPAGPLSSYLGTIQRNLPKGVFADTINSLADKIAKDWGPKNTEMFEDSHPVHAANNPVFHFNPPPNPPGVFNSPRIHLIDSGMDNNLPLYPLAHPSREVDIIIAIDASSDVEKDTFFQRVQGFGDRKGYTWTARQKPSVQNDDTGLEKHPTAESIYKKFEGRYCQIYDGEPTHPAGANGEPILGDYNTPQASKPVALAYMPLLSNKIDPEFNPCTAPFVGSYNLKYTPEQVQQLTDTIVANWRECEQKVKDLVIEVWQKKKAARMGNNCF